MTERVLISGASGFIASHTVAALLEAGFQVTGTVRNPNNAETTAHLRALPGADACLELVKADLMVPGAFDAYTPDADYVIHMASPFQLTVGDPDRDLVQPAVRGTLSMLEACAKSKRVKRVVQTSSMAAITDEPDGSRVLTETDWNEQSSLTRNPYYYSKVRAERVAWDFVEKRAPSWDLVVINPFLVVGPSMTKALNESPKVLADLINGTYPAIMDLTLGFVDVRDVAAAHVLALKSEKAQGRYICAGETRHMRDIVALLRANGYAHAKLPRIGLNNTLAWLASFTQPKGVGTYLRTHIGRVPRYDNTKIHSDLGLTFRPTDESLLETCRDLAQWGHIPQPEGPGRGMKRIAIAALGLALTAVLAAAGAAWIAFGGGADYPDLTTAPRLPAAALETAVTFERPIGNAAVAADGRIFFTVHPESHPANPKLYAWKDGAASPFPDAALQAELFESPLGVVVDRQNRLWVIDPGNHGFGQPALTAFDIDTGAVVHRHVFDDAIAPMGSFLQDLQIDSAGRYVYIADVGFWAKRPALVVYDTETTAARRTLQRHASVYPQDYLIRTPIRDMRYFGGLLAMKTGVDGIALSRDDAWLYYAAMNHTTLYRVPTHVLNDFTNDQAAVEAAIDAVGEKPLNDGLSIDNAGNVFVTDVEHQAVLSMAPDGTLETVIKDSRIRWADGLSFGPQGWLYLADSAIPHLVLQSPAHIAAQAPYIIWRFRPGTQAAAGQ